MTNQPSAPGIAFRRLGNDDLPLMQRWLNHPPVKQWYDDPSETLEMVRDSYGPSIAGLEPTQPFIFAIEGRPAGYIQSYRPKDWPDYWGAQHLPEGAAGIDLFIGEDDFRHRGFGPLVINAFIDQILAPDPSITEIIIDPDPANRIAIRAYEKAGFVRLREIGPPEHYEPALLMVRPVHIQKSAQWGDRLGQSSLKDVLLAADRGSTNAPDPIVEDSIAEKIRFSSGRAKGSLEPTLNLIASMHTVPSDVPRLTTLLGDALPPTVQGTLDVDAGVIRISARSPLRRLAFTHEVGHAIDWWALGAGSSWSSETANSPAADVISTYLDTMAGQRLLSINRHDPIATYLLRPREIWARSYAQFIAVRTGDARLLSELSVRAQASRPTAYPYTVADDDFEDVAKAIIALLGDQGWLINKP